MTTMRVGAIRANIMHAHATRAHAIRLARSAVAASVLLTCTLTSTLAAQEPQPTRTPAEAAQSRDDSGWHAEQCMAGLTYGAPLKLALSYGGGLLHESNNGPDVCALGVAKIGFGGAQGSLGIGTSFAPWGTGVMVTGNLLRTFSSPWNATPRSTYVGASIHLWPAFALGGEIGYYVRVGDGQGAPGHGRNFVGWSAGFGF